jgi:metallo-beta-lactamase class B
MSEAAALAAAAALLAAPAGITQLSETAAKWNAPVAPFRISSDIYYVGTKEIAVFLVSTPKGLILIDTGFAQNVGPLLANVRALGFDPQRIRYILISHGHFDHAGGTAEVKARTGAKVAAGAADGPLLARGGLGDPQFGDAFRYPPVRLDLPMRDGQQIVLGGVAITAHLTPGHTPGCTTWTMPTSIEGRRVGALFLCSVTAPGYRLVGNPRYPRALADYRRSFAVLRTLKCELFLAAHSHFFDLDRKRAEMLKTGSSAAFIDPAGCRAHLKAGEADVLALAKAQGAS